MHTVSLFCETSRQCRMDEELFPKSTKDQTIYNPLRSSRGKVRRTQGKVEDVGPSVLSPSG